MTDYDALVNELRDCRNMAVYSPYWWDITTKAADAIEELQAGEKKFLRNISALETENENLKRARRWIPVTERLPEKYQYAVCWVNDEGNKRGFYGIGSLSRIGDWYVDGDDYSENGNLHVTHWMSLPAPPKEET